MKDSYARDSLNSPRRMSRFRLLVLDAPCTERYARCGERTGVNHPLLLDYLSTAAKIQKRNFSNISLGETFVFYHEATKGLVE